MNGKFYYVVELKDGKTVTLSHVDSLDEQDEFYVFKKGDEEIAKFREQDVIGWHRHDEVDINA